MIPAEIVGALKIVLSPDSEQRLKDATTNDPRAYELYLKGKSYLREASDQDVVGKAQRCFEQAIEIDAGYARAYAGLCEAYLIQYHNVHSGEFFDLARTASEKSIEQDPFSLDGRLSLGKLYNESGCHDEALVELKSGLELDFDNVDTKSEMVRALTSLDRVDEAERLIHEVIAQQPDFWKGHLLLANHYFNRGNTNFHLHH